MEQEIPGFEYTLNENLYGRGRTSRKLGDSVWPEMNFVLIAYVPASAADTVQNCVAQIRQKFPHEGINLFMLSGGR